MSYKPKDTTFPTIVEGNVRTSGSSLTLGVGELAIVDLSRSTNTGVEILSDFTNLRPDSRLAIRIGKPKDNASRSEDNKAISTIPFTLKDLTDFYVDAPQKKGITVDDFVIGYNGKDGTEIDLDNSQNEVIEVTLKGNIMGMIGLPDRKHIARINLTAPTDGVKGTDWTMEEVITEAYETLKNYKLPGNIPITEFVDLMLVNSENPTTLPGTGSTTYNLMVQDDGTYSDLGKVQAQYPALDVKRVKWESGFTTYSTISTSTPAAYQPKKLTNVKDCNACQAGYSELTQGAVYEIINENPTDITAQIQAITGATAGTAVLISSDGDTKTYSVVTNTVLTDAVIKAFITTHPAAKFILISDDVVDLCQQTVNPASIAWVQGETCNATTEVYKITLKDTECGASRLSELQAAFPDLSISQDGNATRSITLTGTSGGANITIGGTNYAATFATDLTTTASNFITSHAADILKDHRVTVTSNGAIITLAYEVPYTPTVAVATSSGNLSGNIAAEVVVPSAGQCQRTYYTRVTSNLVCDECSPEFRDTFETVAPDSFDNVPWEKEPKVYSPTAKMGIRVRGKRATLAGNEFLRDDMFFFDDSVEISLVGGFPTYTNESYLEGTAARFAVKFFSRKSQAHNLGGRLRKYEEEAQVQFNGRCRYYGNNYGKLVNGQETRLKALGSYVVYSLTVSPLKFNSNFQQAQNGAFTYHFTTELGKHRDLENLLNRLASAANLPIVQAASN